MSDDINLILERVHSPEFNEIAKQAADNLWDVIVGTCGAEGAHSNEDWAKFYVPAMHHGIMRRLAVKCREGEEGWYEVFCNAVREATIG